jgi:hypothetical protein
MSEVVKVTIKYESQTDLSERWTDAKGFAQQLKTVYGVEAAEPDATYTSTKITVRIFSALADFHQRTHAALNGIVAKAKEWSRQHPGRRVFVKTDNTESEVLP